MSNNHVLIKAIIYMPIAQWQSHGGYGDPSISNLSSGHYHTHFDTTKTGDVFSWQNAL